MVSFMRVSLSLFSLSLALSLFVHVSRLSAHGLSSDSANRATWDAVNLILLSWTTFEIPVSMLFADNEQVAASHVIVRSVRIIESAHA